MYARLLGSGCFLLTALLRWPACMACGGKFEGCIGGAERSDGLTDWLGAVGSATSFDIFSERPRARARMHAREGLLYYVASYGSSTSYVASYYVVGLRSSISPLTRLFDSPSDLSLWHNNTAALREAGSHLW